MENYYKSWNREKNCFEKVKKETINYGKSATDKSKYRPNVSCLTGANGTNKCGVYDFPDGKDTGVRMYTLRNKGADIVEIDNYIKTEIEKGREIRAEIFEKAYQEALEEMNSNAKDEEVTTSKTMTE